MNFEAGAYVNKTSTLVVRAGALGDVLMTTPIVARLRKELGPEAVIDVLTGAPIVYQRNSDVTGVGRRAEPYDRVIDLDMVCERDRAIHPIISFMREAFGDDEGDRTIVLSRQHAPVQMESLKIAVIHPAVSWPNRTFPKVFWIKVAAGLVAQGFTVIATGTYKDHQVIGRGVVDLRNQLVIHQQADLIARAQVFIGSDSGPLSIAASTETPIVAICTTTRYTAVVPYRHGELGWRVRSIAPDIECYGCSAEHKDVTYVGCHRGDNACIDMIDADAVISAAVEIAVDPAQS